MLRVPSVFRLRQTRVVAAFVLFAPLPGYLISQSGPASERLGTVSFPTSCAPAVQKDFEHAVAMLHSFTYSPAQIAFRAVAAEDPGCAMAHWGIAMTYFHQLWDPPLPDEALLNGRREIQQAQAIGAASDRERRFINALALLYGDDTVQFPYGTRVSKYLGAMAELAAAYPRDVESQAFYALALLAAASPFDKTHAKQKQAAKVLEPLFRKYPDHPGIAHYLIHACDNAEMASQGLAPALAYSKIAPSAPHALHMPSHIFTRLGMWTDSIASNRAASTAARNQGDIGEELHAMDYLVYAYLQQGRYPEARQVVQQLHQMSGLNSGSFKVAYASTAMPVRYAIERSDWKAASAIVPPDTAPPHVIAVAVWARAVGLAHSGHADETGAEIEKLARLEQQLRATNTESAQYWAGQVHVLSLEARAWTAQAEGNSAEAQSLLRVAADQEDAAEKLPTTPGPILPAREQLGDLLLEQNHPRQALKQFQIALSNAPKRRGALIGEARAVKLLATGPSNN
ncbi:MAG TPA: hypothetical protein VGR47_08010 [Terracidiphilus sp.]|nr:hypothetical protein [Terracidiphilus sp.]